MLRAPCPLTRKSEASMPTAFIAALLHENIITRGLFSDKLAGATFHHCAVPGMEKSSIWHCFVCHGMNQSLGGGIYGDCIGGRVKNLKMRFFTQLGTSRNDIREEGDGSERLIQVRGAYGRWPGAGILIRIHENMR